MRRSTAAVHSRLIQFKNVQKHYFDLWALKKFLTNFAVIQAAGVSKSVKNIKAIPFSGAGILQYCF